MALHVLEHCRITVGPLASTSDLGNHGAFLLQSPEPGWMLRIIVSAADDPVAEGWEHISVCAITQARMRTPNWREMAHIKTLHWDAEDVVVQFHPRKSEYVNLHPHVLHLWRLTRGTFPTPPPVLVGPLPHEVTHGPR